MAKRDKNKALIVICWAFRKEGEVFFSLTKKLGKIFKIGNIYAVNLLCGPGKVKAAVDIMKYIHIFPVKFVISSGMCAGVSPKIKRIGQILTANCVIEFDQPYFKRHLLDFSFKEKKKIFLSGDFVLSSAKYRDFLYRKYKAIGLDWESAGLARVCKEKNIGFRVIRAVSDFGNKRAYLDYYINVPVLSKRLSIYLLGWLKRNNEKILNYII